MIFFLGEIEDMLNQVILRNNNVTNLLRKLLREQNEFVTKEELKKVEERLVIKIKTIQKRLLNVIREKASDLPDFFGHEEMANLIIDDLEGLFLEIAASFILDKDA
ncbi:unnamed protein product [Eruca vesicaria subsp. sativa]|uniref:Uncharacterized protein n=1 Tax=Eruca vesicaria subsp. sativa TaxID=29727 RepID=A0ABC8JDW4_ERUVS|nr:unnamed protein product [Eruca vesicaria subsp. sativa]